MNRQIPEQEPITAAAPADGNVRLTAKQFLEEFATEILQATDIIPIINGYAKHLEAREAEVQA